MHESLNFEMKFEFLNAFNRHMFGIAGCEPRRLHVRDSDVSGELASQYPGNGKPRF